MRNHRSSFALYLTTLLFGFIGINSAWAQIPSTISDNTTASIVTVMPGDDAYNIFGHTAIRIADNDSGFDALFNYGTFDFTPGFVPKFIRGKLDYSLSVSGTLRAIEFYSYEERTVVEQVLDLNAEQTERLYQFLRINYAPENRYYRYDFFFDNCSTRIRDVLSAVLGDSLAWSNGGQQQESFRDLLYPYLVDAPLLSTGIDLAIGSDADRVASAAERTFLPVELEHQLDEATLNGRQLVASTDTLYLAPQRPLSPWRHLYFVGWAFLLVIIACVLTDRWNRLVRIGDAILYSVTGIAGVVIIGLWFATDHVVTDANLNLAWAFPLNLMVAANGYRARFAAIRWYLVPYAIVLLTLIAGWPWWHQDLPDSLLPIVLLLLIRTISKARSVANPSRRLATAES